MLSKAGEIRRDEACLDYSGNDVVLYPCHGSKGNQVMNNSLLMNPFYRREHFISNFAVEIHTLANLILAPEYESEKKLQ